MKQDSSSSVLNSRSRPQQYHSGGLATPDWPAFSIHPPSALSLHGSQEDYRSEGEINAAVKPTHCLLLSELKWKSFAVGLLKFTFTLKEKGEKKTSCMEEEMYIKYLCNGAILETFYSCIDFICNSGQG